MKHALLVGVPERAKTGYFEPVEGIDAMAGLLDDLGGWSVTVCTAEAATRPRVRAALEAMVSACKPGDTCLFYFFGHGGVVRFSGLNGDLGRRAVFYLATLRPVGSQQRVGLLDVEVSDALARLDQICANVTAIIDCCHAAEMVREGWIPTVTPPPWVVELDDEYTSQQASPLLLAAEGHPRIVRLFGSSSLRHAYATRRASGLYGLLTQSFVDVVRESGLRCDRLTWDTVAHRAREWASDQRGMEEQRVVLAGPRHRLLFSTHTAPMPHSAAFIPGATNGRGWIRAGALQGVHVGDRWGIATLALGSDLLPRFEVEAEVRRVDLDSSEVVLSDPTLRPVLGATAILQKLDQRSLVAVDGPGELNEALEGSGFVRPVARGDEGIIACVRQSKGSADTIDIVDGHGCSLWLDVPMTADNMGEVVELLEDRARTRRFEQSLIAASSFASTSTDLMWRWGVIDPNEEPRPMPIPPLDARQVPRVRVGQRLWVELKHGGSTPRQWFVSVLEVGIEGRLSLLNTHQPDGMEVVPGVTAYVGIRAHRCRQGLTCQWPTRVPTDQPRQQHLIILASRRPIGMGHLVGLPRSDDSTTFAAQGLGIDTKTRGPDYRPFTVSEEWTWGRIRFEVDPRTSDPP